MNEQNPIFVTQQRWIYISGKTLSEALHNLATALQTIDTIIPVDEYTITDLDNSIIKVFQDRDGFSRDITYRIGMCVSWKRGCSP